MAHHIQKEKLWEWMYLGIIPETKKANISETMFGGGGHSQISSWSATPKLQTNASIGTATTEMVLTLTMQKNLPKDCRPTLKMAKFPNGKKTITNGVLRFLVKRAKFVIAQVFGLISVELKWECPTKNFLPKTKFLLAANTVGATVATVWEQKKIGLVHIRLKLTK